jgi:ketosteroid isomerase-like protein
MQLVAYCNLISKGAGMPKSALDVARASLQAYVDKDRGALEDLVAPDFHFTSPLDNALDRETYFLRCWPNSEHLDRFDEVFENETGDRAVIVYDAWSKSGKRFRNCEVYTVRDGRLVATEVYFGWDLPHRAQPGSFIEDQPAH